MHKFKICNSTEDLEHMLKSSTWTKQILIIISMMLTIHLVTDVFGLFFAGSAFTGIFSLLSISVPFILWPLILIMGYLCGKLKNYNSYLIIVLLVICSSLMAITHATMTLDFSITFIMVMCWAINYFDKKAITFAFVLNVIAYMVCLIMVGGLPINMIIGKIIQAILTFSLIYVIFLGVIIRVTNFVKDFAHSLEVQKDLTTQKIIMEQASKIDALTNLYNHRTFHKCMLELTERNTTNNLPLQLAIIDIDYFKKVNDTYGHSVGDIVLKTVAENIKNLATPQDIVSRYGGEEFAVIFTNKTLQESADILEKMRETISQIYFEEIEWNITISAGIHEHIKGEHKDQSFIKADKALYKAKNGGRNKIVVSE